MRTRFRDLPREAQREAERLARKGRQHPDFDVASAGYEWAGEVRTRYKRSPGAGAAAGLFDIAIQTIGGFGGMVGGQQLAERLLARQLLKLGSPSVR